MLKNIFHALFAPGLRGKILFVLGAFLTFRVLANIPVPGINAQQLEAFFAGNSLFGVVNIFTGGAMDKFSIAMLGLGPYITASVVLQLLTMIFPALEALYKEEGEAGRKVFNQYARMLTVPFALLQGYAFLALLSRQPGVILDPTPSFYLTALATITAGTVLLMWIGELISEQGLGNGVSLLIFAGIVADFPVNIGQLISQMRVNSGEFLNIFLFLAMAAVILLGSVFITEARRNIPVSYAKRVRGNKVYGGVSTYLPLNMNPAGVMPIIFALSLLTFPTMIANFFQSNPGFLGSVAYGVQRFFANQWIYGALYFMLVAVFTYFYTAVTFDPKSVSTNLQKMGGFIPGIRPGQATAHFISFILNRILLVGAVFLGLIAVMPSIVQGITGITVFQFLVGGTALLIMVSVALETIRQFRAQLQMRDYESF
ncbi:MAG: preprotein translocase subunit SecY [Candidatus Wildermuthbacteria bacterium]|nr:preprotein translocase subunit SecY [Candidatus Wildermuthbacteria bacterium]